MWTSKNHSDHSERRNSRNFQRWNTHEQRIAAAVSADVQSVFKNEKLSQDGIDYILKHEKLVDCEIYILKLLDKRAWKPEMALHLDVSKLAKSIMDACSDEDLKKLVTTIAFEESENLHDYGTEEEINDFFDNEEEEGG